MVSLVWKFIELETVGILIFSGLIWAVIIILAGYPQLIFLQMVEARKQASLQKLEQKLIQAYYMIVNENDAPPAVTEIIQIYRHVSQTPSSPTSFGTFVGLATTALLNVGTIPIGFFEVLDF